MNTNKSSWIFVLREFHAQHENHSIVQLLKRKSKTMFVVCGVVPYCMNHCVFNGRSVTIS